MKPKENVLDVVAARNGITRAEAEREIRAAIREARNSPDPQVRRRWQALWPDGEPRPEEFLTKLAALARMEHGARLS